MYLFRQLVDVSLSGVRLILMRIRFQASDFGQVAKVNLIRAKSKQASCAEMVLGSFAFFARVIQQLGFWAQKIKPHRLLLCPAPRRVLFARSWT